MTTTADLSLIIDTSSVDKAEKALDNLGKKAKETEKKTDDLAGSFDGLRAVGGPISDLADRFENLRQRLNLNLGTAKNLGTAFGVLGTAALGTLGALAFISDQVLKNISDFKELSDTTGASAEGIASLAPAAQMSGVSLQTVASAMQKVALNLAKTDDESANVARGLGAIGIELDTFKKLKPEEQMELVAKQLDGFADGAGKTAVAMQIFGKSGAELMPFFNDLAEAGGRQITLTQQQIEMADEYAKMQQRLGVELKTLTMIAVAQSAPAMSALSMAFNDTLKEMLGLDTAASDLAKNDGIASFATGAARVLAKVVDGAQYVIRAFESIGTSVGALAAMVATAFDSGMSWSQRWEAIKNINSQVNKDLADIWAKPMFSDRVNKALSELEAKAKKTGAETKKALSPDFSKLTSDKGSKGADQSARSLEQLVDLYQKQTDALAKAQGIDVERAQLQRKAEELVKSITGLTAQERDTRVQAVLAIYDQTDALTKQAKLEKEINEAKKEQSKTVNDLLAKTNEYITKQQQAFGDRFLPRAQREGKEREREATGSIDAQIATYTKDLADPKLTDAGRKALEDTIAKLRTARAEALASIKTFNDEKTAAENSIGEGVQRGVLSYLDSLPTLAEGVSSVITSLGDGLTQALTAPFIGGEFNAKNFFRTLLTQMAQLYVQLNIIKPLMESMTSFNGGSSGGSSTSGAMGTLFTAARAYFGFSSGGYTGNGGRGDVAGVVHGQEFVVNAAATARNRSMLEAMNRGATPVASGGASVSVGGIYITVQGSSDPKATAQEVSVELQKQFVDGRIMMALQKQLSPRGMLAA
jgi:lambda family phage tail tape measure protein